LNGKSTNKSQIQIWERKDHALISIVMPMVYSWFINDYDELVMGTVSKVQVKDLTADKLSMPPNSLDNIPHFC
jgi:hypothetical protein